MSNSSSNRQLALEKELQQLIRINKTTATLISTIQKTSTNIQKTVEATQNSKVLLNQWIRILSQASFTNEVINSENWNGRNINISEEEIDHKFKLQKQLEDELKMLSNEKEELVEKIETKENEINLIELKNKELNSKRKNELGLNNIRSSIKRIRARVYK